MNSARELILLWEEKFDILDSVNINEYNEGILYIAPPFVDISLTDGFWDNLNKIFNKMFDYAEEEEIEYNMIPDFIDEIEKYTSKNYKKEGIYKINTGEVLQPNRIVITSEISYNKINRIISDLCNFLSNAYLTKKNVLVLL